LADPGSLCSGIAFYRELRAAQPLSPYGRGPALAALEDERLLARSRRPASHRPDLELQFEIRGDDRPCTWARGGDTQPINDFPAGSQSGWNRQGLCWPGHVYRGPVGHEHGHDGVSRGTFRIQFAAATPSVYSHRAYRDL